MNKKITTFEIEKYLNDYNYDGLLAQIQKYHGFAPQCILYSKVSISNYFNDFHSHEVYEVLYVESGKTTYAVEGNKYELEAGDFLLIPPFTLHKLIEINEYPCKRVILIFTDDYIKKFNTPITDLSLIFDKIKQNNNHKIRIRSAFRNRINSSVNMLEELFLSGEYGDDVIFDATFASLFARMNKGVNFYDVDKYYKNYGVLIKKTTDYINANIDKKILISDISKHVGLSESRISHIYREQIGISITQYIIKKRLSISKDMLKLGSPISEVAIKCGFPDYSSFLRAFKKEFNISPKSYQKQYFTQ